MSPLDYDDGILCWPYWLPIPERGSYGYEPKDVNSRTEMDVGSIVRFKYKTDQTDITCRVILEECEVAWLEAFEAEALNQGAVWFLMPLWIAGNVQHFMVQFTDRPKVTQVQGLTNWIDLKVRIKNRLLPPVSGIQYGDRNTLVVWPSNLPVLQDSYSYEVRKTDMKGATPLTTAKRPEFNIDEVTITLKMSLSMSQITVFEWFERDILNQGARWFKMPVWISGELTNYIVRFKSRPKMALNGFWTEVSCELDLEQRDLLDPTIVQWLRFLSPQDVFYFFDEFHNQVQVVMPGLTIIPDGVYTKV